MVALAGMLLLVLAPVAAADATLRTPALTVHTTVSVPR
jgi:hypothetical protein